MTRRIIPPACLTPIAYSRDGRRLCRQCRRPIADTRTFCGRAECSYLWKCRRDPAFFKAECLRLYSKRCAICGVTYAERLAKICPNFKPGGLRIAPYIGWEADHIRPLWSSNADDPEIIDPRRNGRLLCPCCHKTKTSQETAERAKMRREPNRKVVLNLLMSPQFRLGAKFQELQNTAGVGEALLRSCLADLADAGLAEQRKNRGPWFPTPAAFEAAAEEGRRHQEALDFINGYEP